MTPEIASIVAVGVALAGVILVLRRETARALRGETNILRAEMKDVRSDLAELRERMARIEGMFEGVLRREAPPAAAE